LTGGDKPKSRPYAAYYGGSPPKKKRGFCTEQMTHVKGGVREK